MTDERRHSSHSTVNLVSHANEEGPGPESVQLRTIHINNRLSNKHSKFDSNVISTSKYNVVTFLPKFLFEQFSKYANIFFLFTAGIQQIPGVSPTNRYTTIIPLAAVLLASACKEILEDYKRHKSDDEVNNSITKILENTRFQEQKWSQICVGDIVRVENNQFFPADLVLLSSSEPDALCYIETSNLDGETNLKIKQGLPDTAQILSPEAASHFSGVMETERPNNSLYTFDGTLITTDNRKIPLSPQQLLLRGARLRNTVWIYGVVVFTGHESKLLRNASATPIKRTGIDKMTNVQIIFLFIILVSMAVACALGSLIRTLYHSNEVLYLNISASDAYKSFGFNILTFIILFNNLIPISLIVTVEVVKFQQASLINSDLDMYDEETDTPALARTSNLVEELGQIEYIFSDKTGTLTCNKMEFRNCSIGRKAYASVIEEGKAARMDPDGVERGYHSMERLQNDLQNSPDNDVMDEFLTLLAVCHTVIPEKEEDSNEIIYQASSPDEAALVKGAADLGYRFHTRKPTSVTITVKGEDLIYEILQVCEFNSTRKRMSTIIRCPDGKIKLYCKGADTVIFERLSSDDRFKDQISAQLEDYASEGLRTLCMSMREVSKEEYEEWVGKYNEAATSLVERAQKLDDVAELIEKELSLLGATAIEDKLQDGVPETIHTLAKAGIKIWVLTGDRQETAINIGYSCQLLTEEMSLIIFESETFEETKTFINKKLEMLQGNKDTHSGPSDVLALIINGSSLVHALHEDLEKTFLELASSCKAVICCRVSPLQKALVVKLVKRNTKASLLAIGDGANDVSMIQAAHVGVGIRGVEGLQAARSSDYAISQFRFLKKLLLVHGAWSYQRLSKLILYSFYKNITLYMTQFWYTFFNDFSGQVESKICILFRIYAYFFRYKILYESWTITFYNVIFTVMPPFALGLFDQMINSRMLNRYPQMYQLGQRQQFFNVRSFWGATVNAFYHSAILFFVSYFVFYGNDNLPGGLNAGNWFIGTTTYTAVLATVILKAALLTDFWTKYSVMAIPGSFVLWMVFIPIYTVTAAKLASPELVGMNTMFQTAVFWLVLILSPSLCMLRDYTWKYYNRNYDTKSYHIVQEIQKFNIPDYRPNMDRFRNAVHRVRMIQRMKRNRGYAFSQNESGWEGKLIRAYDTTLAKSRG